MQNPIQLRVDYEVEAGYLRYRQLPTGQHVARTQRISDDVNVDFDAEGQILGLELLAFDETALRSARYFADTHDLAFPVFPSPLLDEAPVVDVVSSSVRA